MRVLKRNPWLPSLGVLLAAVVVGGYARADVTTDQPGSIVIFPKVISDGTRDTLIQLTNTGTMSIGVHCVYVVSSLASTGFCSGTTPEAEPCFGATQAEADAHCIDPDTGNNNGTCVICHPEDFEINLSPLQPTVWRVSTGRNDLDQTKGFFFGAVLGHPTFAGELKCFQSDPTDPSSVTPGNKLKGEAIIENLTSGQISEYNGIAIQATGGLVCSNDSTVNCSVDSDCGVGFCKVILLDGAHYNSCPTQLLVNHYAEGAIDPFTGASVHSELTLVPCTENLESAVPTTTNVLFNSYNEMEQFAGSHTIGFACWLNLGFDDPRLFPFTPAAGFNGSNFGKTRVGTSTGDARTCAGGSNAGLSCQGNGDCPGSICNPPASGVLGVLEEFHRITGQPDGTAAVNLHIVGKRLLDSITLTNP